MKCAVVGGGAAGLMAACALAKGGAETVLLERLSRVGKKLLATGNGRCNFTNLAMSPEHYRGGEAVRSVLEQFPAERIMDEFDRMGVVPVADAQGRVYPASNAAASVLDALRLTLKEQGGREETDFDVVSVKPGKTFRLRSTDGRTLDCDRLLLCCGSAAAPKLGGTDSGYRLLETLGHRVLPRKPAIAPLNTDLTPIKGLKGIRVRCKATLLDGEQIVRSEEGEALFTEYGLSGICVMQLSGSVHACREPIISLDLAPDYPENALFERTRHLAERPLEDLLNGLLPRRLGWNVLRAAKIADLTRQTKSLSRREISAIWNVLRGFSVRVTGVCNFDSAQVAMGGADLTEFFPDTLESRLVPGLYVAGELCDVDGDCGGYNLHWAWASALTAAQAMLEHI